MDLLVLECSSVVAGYRVLQSLNGGRVLDASPTANGFLILVQGTELTALASGAQKCDPNLVHALFSNVSQSVLDAVYSLAPGGLSESLVVCETSSVVAMFEAAAALASRGLRAIEIKIRRSGGCGAYGYFTGMRSACGAAAVEARAVLQRGQMKGEIEVFDQPSVSVRELFGN